MLIYEEMLEIGPHISKSMTLVVEKDACLDTGPEVMGVVRCEWDSCRL